MPLRNKKGKKLKRFKVVVVLRFCVIRWDGSWEAEFSETVVVRHRLPNMGLLLDRVRRRGLFGASDPKMVVPKVFEVNLAFFRS